MMTVVPVYPNGFLKAVLSGISIGLDNFWHIVEPMTQQIAEQAASMEYNSTLLIDQLDPVHKKRKVVFRGNTNVNFIVSLTRK